MYTGAKSAELDLGHRLMSLEGGDLLSQQQVGK
jgi:hypothetical protein